MTVLYDVLQYMHQRMSCLVDEQSRCGAQRAAFAPPLTGPDGVIHPANLLPLFAPLLAAGLGRLPLLLLLLLPLLLLGQTLVKHHWDVNET